MDTYGGISVNEVMAKATGKYPVPPVAEPEPEPEPELEPEPEPEPPPPPPVRQRPPQLPAGHPSSPGLPRPVPPTRNKHEEMPPPRRRPVTGQNPVPGGVPPRRAPARRRPGPPANGMPPAAQAPAPPAPPRTPPAPPRPPRRQPAPPPVPLPEAKTTVTPPVAPPPRPQQQPPPPKQQPPQQSEPRPKPPRPERPKPSAEDRLIMTDQMEPVDDATMYRRKIDNSLARFSAAHDEMQAEEAKRKERMSRFTAAPVKLIEQTRTKLQRVAHPGEGGRPAKPRPHPLEHLDAEEQPEAEETSSSQTRLEEKKQRHHDQATKAGRITAIVLASLMFLLSAAGWGMKTWFNSKFNEIVALDENSADIKNAAGQNGDENFLIAGSDTRAGAEAEEGVGTAESVGGARSDSLMIAHIPADRKRVIVVGFPRDLEVTRPDCKRWDSATGAYSEEVVAGKAKSKLNEAYAIGGPQCTTKQIQQLTGMKINHFVGIDFHGFKDMINVVGGVPVHIEKPVVDDVLGVIVPQAGEQIISGDQALNFVRARKVQGDVTSDYGRIKRQQLVIGSLLKKTMSQEVLFDGGKLTGFINAFTAATFGDNLGVDQMLTLAQSMKGLNPDTVKFITVPTTGEANSRGNEELLQTKSKELFEALIENGPLPDEKAPAPPPSTPAGTQKGQAKPGN
ncbi:LCP family protein required for cell wall assembly [Amycolatopsis magusensis]|uniref:LCP family protein required for cell wall assembly n=2 Tax=Amycolatopsis magusensis TaxID=882444 RepID=A0ABS4PL10_9PSEU|nr:LCP family protein required for cell wall assembly [Amycolatopsis magusensis]